MQGAACAPSADDFKSYQDDRTTRRACQRQRITIAYGHEKAMVPVNGADKFGAWVAYRPTSQRCADGTEIWDQHIESEFGETGLGAL